MLREATFEPPASWNSTISAVARKPPHCDILCITSQHMPRVDYCKALSGHASCAVQPPHLDADCAVKEPGRADAVCHHMHLEAQLCAGMHHVCT